MNDPDQVVRDPTICHGKPVIRGTRVMVSTIVGSIRGGMSREEVIREYGITEEAIEAAMRYQEKCPL